MPDTAPVGVRVRVFANARVDGVRPLPGRDRQVLAVLVVQGAAGCTPEQIAIALYGDDFPTTWRKIVQGTISRLRKVLGPLAVETTATGYRLSMGDEEIDIRRFEHLVDHAATLAATGEHDRAVVVLREALDLGRGDPLVDLDHWEPGRAEAARLRDLQRVAEERVVEALLATGQASTAVGPALANVEREPLREQRRASLAMAQYRSGRQGDALRSLSRARQVLAEELGVEPGPELVALEQRILAQDPSLVEGDVVAPPSTVCPYKGLQSYEVDDAEAFFGREHAVEEGLARLATSPFLAIVGPSGCGKSSLARAGLAPALRRPDRRVLVVTPGVHPVGALEAVRPDDAVVVDQLEELFTTCDDDQERDAFAEALAERTGPTIVTVRADHLAAVAQLPGLARLIEAGLFLLGPMAEADLRAAIEGPATRAGLRLEPGLVDLVLRDVVGQPGALPLLSHSLAEVWARREGRVLTAAAYRDAGGVQGAVGRSAELAIEGLTPELRAIARDLFLRLVTVADGEPVGLRLARTELTDDAPHAAVLEALAKARLLTVDDATVQVAHESLVRAWPRLQTWLDEDGEGQRLRRHLTAAAASWAAADRDAGELYRGARLRAVQEWVGATTPSLTPVEEAFLGASEERASREEADTAVTNRRLRRLLVGAGAAIVVAMLAAGLAVVQGNRAEDERATAEAQARDLAVQELVARANVLNTTKRDLAALLAVAAYEVDPSVETYGGLVAAFTSAPSYERTIPLDESTGAGALVAPDGRSLFVIGSELAVTEVDLRTGHRREVLDGVDPEFQPAPRLVALSPDGSRLARLSSDRHAVLSVTEVDTGEPAFPDIPTSFPAIAVAYSPDGGLLALGGGPQGTVEIRSAADGRLLHTVPGLPQPADTLAQPWTYFAETYTVALTFLPTGRLAITTQAGPLRIVEPRSGREVARYPGPPDTASYVTASSADGRLLVGHSVNGQAAWDLETGELLWTRPPDTQCNALVVADAVGTVLCGSEEGRVWAYDLATGARTESPFDYQFGPVRSLTLADGGAQLIEAGGSAVAFWRLDGGGATARVLVPGDAVPQAYDLDGNLIVTRHRTGPNQDWDLVDGSDGHLLDPFDDMTGVVPIEPGVFAATFADGSPGWYDSRRHVRVPPTGDGLGFAPSGARSTTESLVVWGEEIQVFDRERNHAGPQVPVEGIEDLTVSHDGSRIFTIDGIWGGSTATELVARDPNGRRSAALPVPGVVAAATTSDLVVVGTDDYHLRVLDAETLEPSGRELPGVSSLPQLIRFADDEQRMLVIHADHTVRLADLPSRSFLGGPIDLRRLANSDPLAIYPQESTLYSDTYLPDVMAALRADGGQLALGTGQGVVVWDLEPDQLVAAACRLAGRDLTREEWADHLSAFGPYHPVCAEAA